MYKQVLRSLLSWVPLTKVLVVTYTIKFHKLDFTNSCSIESDTFHQEMGGSLYSILERILKLGRCVL